MQAKLTDRQPTSATLEVTVPAAEVDETFEAVLRAISRQVRVPGFRPGKAPRGVLIKRVGEDALAQEVRDALVEANYPKAVRELELTPVHAHFHAHEPKGGADYTFEVHLDLYPEFTLPDLNEIIIDTAGEALTDDMVEDAVSELRREHATLVPVERAAEPGDYVLVESLASGEPSGNVLPIDLERVDPALAEQLLGKAAGDEVTLRFGEARDEDEWAGGEAGEGETDQDEEGQAETDQAKTDQNNPETTPSLTVIIRDVKAKEKPEPDDDLAATLGFATWDEVLERIRDNLQTQLESDAFEAQREEFVDKLVAETEVALPASLVNRRKASLLSSLAEDLKGRNLNLEQYVKTLEEKGEREGFEAELQQSAESAVRRDLVLERLLEARGSTVSDQEFAAAMRFMAARQGKDPARFRTEMGESWAENYRFLLARDKAVREAVRESLGLGPEDSDDLEDQDDGSSADDLADEQGEMTGDTTNNDLDDPAELESETRESA